jgi:hypothetical protein
MSTTLDKNIAVVARNTALKCSEPGKPRSCGSIAKKGYLGIFHIAYYRRGAA